MRSAQRSPTRLFRHLMMPAWRVEQVLAAGTFDAVEAAIRSSEAMHRAELRFAVEGSLDLFDLLRGVTPRQRALEVFSQLGVWDTEENNGVLVYLLLADHDFEIVADRGVHRLVGDAGWEPIAARMEAAFRAGDFQRGIVDGITAIGEVLARHYPRREGDRNELPDRPVVL
jgi:uncharacterized membrane protein